jgi:hypothetical protein
MHLLLPTPEVLSLKLVQFSEISSHLPDGASSSHDYHRILCSFVGNLGMIILDNFEESCSYTFRTKYFDPILAWVHEILVGIILEEQPVSGNREQIRNVERMSVFFVSFLRPK